MGAASSVTVALAVRRIGRRWPGGWVQARAAKIVLSWSVCIWHFYIYWLINQGE